MDLLKLGMTKELYDHLKDTVLSDFSVGRVTQEHRERYIVSTGDKEYSAEVTGNLRYTAHSRADFPAVGDWVKMTVYDSDQAVIHEVLPRKSVLKRQDTGKIGETQLISANIDTAFIVQSLKNNFSINRLERYLTICYSAGIEPVLVISKIDLSTEKEIRDAICSLEDREKTVRFILLSNMTLKGLDQVLDIIQPGRTYCVIGSSGVGKSTLINNLLKKNLLRTGQISHSTNKGRHTTDHRELFILENGGIVIDTPGMRELGITDDAAGIKTTFQDISDISLKCKFTGCRHTGEKGCAVIEALDKGVIDQDSYDNYLRLLEEQERFQTTVSEKRRKDRAFGKMIKNYHKVINKNTNP